MMQFFNWKIA